VSEVNYFRRKYVWTTIIIDEGHRIKNSRAQLSEKLRVIPSLGKAILTGTPLQNNLKEVRRASRRDSVNSLRLSMIIF
jgi:SWI/SNF-related matrix-associated actin-dependent regulator of chromatin subfamily A member 5